MYLCLLRREEGVTCAKIINVVGIAKNYVHTFSDTFLFLSLLAFFCLPQTFFCHILNNHLFQNISKF